MYLYTLILLFLASVNVNAYADPGACSGDCWTHDPGLYQRKSDGKYFRFATGGGIHIASADSLEGPWTDDGYVLPNGSSINLEGKNNLWVCSLSLYLCLVAPNIPGPRPALPRWDILPLLRGFITWLAELGHWSCDLQDHGSRQLDRPWLHRHRVHVCQPVQYH
jgi:hypothetical protein